MRITWWATALILALSLGCTRKSEKPSSLGISLKGLVNSSKAGSLSISEITHVVLNINGPGMSPIVRNYDAHDGRTIPDPIIVEGVKSGDGRLVQILAVGDDDSTGTEYFLYGDQTVNLKGGDNPIAITVKSIASGTGTQAQIGGRYLEAGGTSGPTGTLQLTFKPPTAPAMQIMESPMINGWFQIFLIDGAAFSYHFKHDPSKRPFEGIDFNHAMFSPAQHVLHVVQPAGTAYFSHDQRLEPRAPERHIVGFFGPGATTPQRTVCYDGNEGNVSNMYLDPAHTVPMEWRPDESGTSYVRRLGQAGGVEDPDGPCASGTAFVNRLDFDGKNVGSGRTKSFGFESAFKVPEGEWEPIEANESGGVVTLSWETLPGAGAGEGAIDGFGVFASTIGFEGSIDRDGIDCQGLASDPSTGFQHIGDTASTSFALPSLTAAQIEDLRVAVCPYKAGYLGQARYYFKGATTNQGGGGAGGSGPATMVGFRHGSMVTNASSCTELDVVLLNASNTHSDPALNTGVLVDLTYTNSSGSPALSFRDGGCGGSTLVPAEITIPSGENSYRIGISASVPTGVAELSATASSPVLVSESATEFFTVAGASEVTRMNFIGTGAVHAIAALPVNVCTGIKVEFFAAGNTPTNVFSATSVALSGATFYSDSICTSTTTTAPAAASTSETSVVYVRPTSAGHVTLQGQVSGYTPSSGDPYSFSTMYGLKAGAAGTPVALKVSLSSGSPLTAGTCYELTVETVDAFGTPYSIPATLSPIKLYYQGNISGGFYTDAICTSSLPLDQTLITGGNSSTAASTLYFSPSTSGAFHFNATAGGGSDYWSGYSESYTVNP